MAKNKRGSHLGGTICGLDLREVGVKRGRGENNKEEKEENIFKRKKKENLEMITFMSKRCEHWYGTV